MTPFETPLEYNEDWTSIAILQVTKRGLPEAEIPTELGIPAEVFDHWKTYPDVQRAIKLGHEHFLDLAKDSLRKSATGYDWTGVETIVKNGETTTRTFVRHFPANPTAIIALAKHLRTFQIAKQLERNLPAGFEPNFSDDHST